MHKYPNICIKECTLLPKYVIILIERYIKEMKIMTANEVLELIKNLENSERWELLELMYDEYYNSNLERGEKSA
ncbi:hypothetical protein COF77_25215 [Bacillus wiedmannii]|nr:hypothetical protein COF77_25215 [Bacillus wiedmannii]